MHGAGYSPDWPKQRLITPVALSQCAARDTSAHLEAQLHSKTVCLAAQYPPAEHGVSVVGTSSDQVMCASVEGHALCSILPTVHIGKVTLRRDFCFDGLFWFTVVQGKNKPIIHWLLHVHV